MRRKQQLLQRLWGENELRMFKEQQNTQGRKSKRINVQRNPRVQIMANLETMIKTLDVILSAMENHWEGEGL